jgi:REP element-mobilizing transposase RayT
MAQSFATNYLHVIFSTKHRQPFIDENIEMELHKYLGGICNGLESRPIEIGGYWDHVHILCLLSKKITLIKLLEDVKSDSSRWVKTKGESYKQFYWQGGYGAFSVSPYEVDTVRTYIRNQHEHHKTETYQDEYRRILRKNEIDFDERFIWD